MPFLHSVSLNLSYDNDKNRIYHSACQPEFYALIDKLKVRIFPLLKMGKDLFLI